MRNLRGKFVAYLSSILVILLLVFTYMAAGCSTGTPSEGDMEEAIFAYLTRSATALTEKPCHKPEAVEVIEVEEISEKNKMTTWSVAVNVICSSEEVQAQYDIFKDIFGDIKVLRRSG